MLVCFLYLEGTQYCNTVNFFSVFQHNLGIVVSAWVCRSTAYVRILGNARERGRGAELVVVGDWIALE